MWQLLSGQWYHAPSKLKHYSWCGEDLLDNEKVADVTGWHAILRGVMSSQIEPWIADVVVNDATLPCPADMLWLMIRWIVPFIGRGHIVPWTRPIARLSTYEWHHSHARMRCIGGTHACVARANSFLKKKTSPFHGAWGNGPTYFGWIFFKNFLN